MKANIAGIQVEGTPEEIIKFRELLAKSDVEFKGGYVTVRADNLSDSEIKEMVDRVYNELQKKRSSQILSEVWKYI